MTGKIRLRIALGMVVVAGLVVAGLASRSGADPNAAIACPAIQGSIARPACGPVWWCCGTGSLKGVTATGQASLKGSSAQVRDQAIRQAVADAKQQAETAAQAAGIKLGQVIDMQISSSGFPYPLGVGVAGTSTGEATSVVGQAVPPSAPCAFGKVCPEPIAVPVQTFVSVTVTWAIA
jgi:hypothetical protein